VCQKHFKFLPGLKQARFPVWQEAMLVLEPFFTGKVQHIGVEENPEKNTSF
jgi:hypothetical protein